MFARARATADEEAIHRTLPAPCQTALSAWPAIAHSNRLTLVEEVRNRVRWPSPLAPIPTGEQVTALYRLARAQNPRHSPQGEETPPFADQWMADYDRGRDVVDWYHHATTAARPATS